VVTAAGTQRGPTYRVPVRSVLAVLVAATFAAALAVVVDDARQDRGTTVVEIEEGDTVVVPPAGQAEISGTVEAGTAEHAVAPVLPLPLHASAQPGQAGITIERAIVDGEAATIVWDGGRPFTLGGDGGIDLGATRVDIGRDGVNWPLDGEPRGLTPGTYTVEAPVAVGRAGLASPMDRVTFTAGEGTTIVTTGGIAVRTAPSPLRLEGPGSITLRGALTIRTADGTRDSAIVRFGPGPFVVDLVPVAGGWRVDGTVKGPLH